MNKVDNILHKIHEGTVLRDELTALKTAFSYAKEEKLFILNPELDNETLNRCGNNINKEHIIVVNDNIRVSLLKAIQDVEMELLTLFIPENEQNK